MTAGPPEVSLAWDSNQIDSESTRGEVELKTLYFIYSNPTLQLNESQ